MRNKNLLEPYHYTECGLDNVYLYNIPLVQDVEKEEVICIPNINLLHKMIAKGIICKKGCLKPKEIKFLRVQLGFKQSDFAALLGKDSQSVGRWERGENRLDKTTDILIRVIVINYLDIDINMEALSSLPAQPHANNDNINIDGLNSKYELMRECV